ncbi:MAG TPA: HAMP domain-containing sensor histidine kinase [Methylocella sp.]|nr:HAMP domain-containing sensor histidine kinase [Methylocella sp.]
MWAFEIFKTATFRLAVIFALAVSAATAIVFVFIYWQVATFDVKRLNVILVDEAARAVSLPEDRVKRELERRFTSDLRQLDYAALFDQSGKLQYGNVETLPQGLPIDGKAHTVQAPAPRGENRGTESAVFVAVQRQDGGIVLLGRSLYEVRALREVVFQALMIGIVPAVLSALAIGTIFSLRGTRRLKAINETIVRIMQGDLQERLPTQGKMDDLNYVASAVNLMLDEIVRLLNQLKSVGDNIAHDLRAPLAVMHAKLERGLSGQSDLRIAAKRALNDLDQALATVSALLRISEIEFGRRRSAFQRVDLREVCTNVFELYQPLAEAKAIALTLKAPAPIPVNGDFDLLVEAFANLVDNAIKFTPTGGKVSITVYGNATGFRVCMADNGPGIPAGERDKIFKRFYRSPNCDHIPGTGLGLSMAATIADVHGFDLRVEDNQPGAVFVLSSRQANRSSFHEGGAGVPR